MRFKRLAAVSMILFTALITLSCSRLSNSFGREVPKLFPIRHEGKWGYINNKGEVVIQPQFLEALFFFEGLSPVATEYGKYGYIDQTGKFVINPQFQMAARFSDGLAAVTVGDRVGYIDKTGKLVINPQFDKDSGREFGLGTFSEGLARVKVGDKYGFIDREGKVVINPQFDAASPFFDGLAAAKVGNKFGYIGPDGNIVINPQFDYAQPFSNGLAAVRIDKQIGYIDKTGKFVINPQFDMAFPFSDEGLALVMLDKKVGFVDESGKYAINPQFIPQPIGVDWETVFIITPDIGRISFSEGFAPAQAGEESAGYIGKDGKFIINPQFSLALPFYGGMALVVSKDSASRSDLAWVDSAGKYVWRETREPPKTSSEVNANAGASNANAALSNTNTAVVVNSNMSSANVNLSAPNSTSGERTGRLTMDANLRSEPNKDSASVGIHYRDAQVRVLDQTSYLRDNEVTTWYRIRVYKYGCSNNTNLGCGKNMPGDADEGWVNAKLVLLN